MGEDLRESSIMHMNKSNIAPIERREQYHHDFVRTALLRDGVITIGSEWGFLKYLAALEALANDIVACGVLPTELFVNAKKMHACRLTKLGDRFWRLCKAYDGDVVAHYKRHHFNPHLTVMLKVMKKWAGGLVGCSNTSSGRMDVSNSKVKRQLDAIFAVIRRVMRSEKFRGAVKNCKDKERISIVRCSKYFAALFRKRSRLLILRVDLYFRPQAKGLGYTVEGMAHFERFLRALREGDIVGDVMGYISKREDGVDRGLHYHLIIALDGNDHRDGANLARLIGEHWEERCGRDEVGNKMSSYFNCYTRKDQYKFNCLGVMHQADNDMMMGLRCAIEYLCKETSQLKPNPDMWLAGHDGDAKGGCKGIRNLRKGKMPKGHSGRGAPRTRGLDFSAINKVLLAQ